MGRRSSLKTDSQVCAEKHEMLPSKAEGIILDLAGRNKSNGGDMSINQIAAKWDVAFGVVSSIQKLAKVSVKDVRDGLIGKNLVIANVTLDALHDKICDPEVIKEMPAGDLARIAKSTTDTALNLTQGQVGGGVNINLAIGDIRALRERTEAHRPSLAERLAAKGVIDVPATT